MYNFYYLDNGSITDVAGIKAAGIHCGLKKRKKDLALIYSELPATVAGTFTLNKVKAPPLIISEKKIKEKNKISAILINSGNANAATGEKGIVNANKTVEILAEQLFLPENEILISSTGVIGQQLNMKALEEGIKKIKLKLSPNGGIQAAEAILTTDTFAKHFAMEMDFGNSKKGKLGAICKGSGMIMPNMATMLAFITTDLEIEQQILQSTLNYCVNESFNKISIDGETSTNDMVILLANGKSNLNISEDADKIKIFRDALLHLTKRMAKTIIQDGEGSTKALKVVVKNAKDKASANKAAKAIANSLLVKTAITGADANWGRILSAVGNAGIDFKPESTEIFFDDLQILHKNYITSFSEEKAKEILSKSEIELVVDLNNGKEKTEWWTTDLTEKYIKINAFYRT